MKSVGWLEALADEKTCLRSTRPTIDGDLLALVDLNHAPSSHHLTAILSPSCGMATLPLTDLLDHLIPARAYCGG
jgi:hypothetical protein